MNPTRSNGVSQRIRKRVAEVFGRAKTVAGWRNIRFRGRARAEAGFLPALAACNLIRRPKLLEAAGAAQGMDRR